MSFSQKNENKKKSIEEIFRKILLKIDNFHSVEKDSLVYTEQSQPVSDTMETDRRNSICIPVVLI